LSQQVNPRLRSTSQLHGNQTKAILNKDRDGEASPFVMLLVTLPRMASMVLEVVVMPSS